ETGGALRSVGTAARRLTAFAGTGVVDRDARLEGLAGVVIRRSIAAADRVGDFRADLWDRRAEPRGSGRAGSDPRQAELPRGAGRSPGAAARRPGRAG